LKFDYLLLDSSLMISDGYVGFGVTYSIFFPAVGPFIHSKTSVIFMISRDFAGGPGFFYAPSSSFSHTIHRWFLPQFFP